MKNIVGTQIGLYDILYQCEEKSNDGHKMYHIKCSKCGWETDAQGHQIKNLSKICNHKNIAGQYIPNNCKLNWKNKRLHSIYQGMIIRCYDTQDRSYRWYGAKGISICKEWILSPISFEVWALENGYSDNLTIDRIDENKNYCPENCRWISANNNSKYKSTTSYIRVEDVIHTGQDWARLLGFGQNLINIYIRKYGLDNTIEFIKCYQKNPTLIPRHKQSYYDLYMNQ